MKIARGWKRAALAVAGLVVLEVGARIVAPGINVDALANYLRNGGGSWLIGLYNQLGGGGLVRGGVFALGIAPFLAAKLYVRLARTVSARLDAMSRNDAGRSTLTRWTRALTVGLAGIQAFGFSRFVQGIPGAVAHPGLGFITRTTVVLTVGAVLAMVIGETAGRAMADDEPDEADEPDDAPVPPLLGEPTALGPIEQRAGVNVPSRPAD